MLQNSVPLSQQKVQAQQSRRAEDLSLSPWLGANTREEVSCPMRKLSGYGNVDEFTHLIEMALYWLG